MRSGEIVRAGAEKDTLVFVGLMGTVKVAFQVMQIGDSRKVVPQRYFHGTFRLELPRSQISLHKEVAHSLGAVLVSMSSRMALT